jgi:hypothetical protein
MKTITKSIFTLLLSSTLSLAQEAKPADTTSPTTSPCCQKQNADCPCANHTPCTCKNEKQDCKDGACSIQNAPTPEKPKWTMGGEARFRFETRDNRDLNSAVNDNDSYTLSRVRLNVGFEPSEKLKAFVQPQFSGVWGQGTASVSGNGTVTGGVVNSGGFSDPTISMHQAYANWEMVDDLHLIIGRQEMTYGDEVVIGPVGFSNIGRSFDAALIRSLYEKNTTDYFYSKVADDDVTGTFYSGELDFAGFNTAFSNISSIDALDAYGLYLRDARTGSPTIFNFGTAGLRIKDKIESFDYRFEGNAQFGEHSGSDMLAYMFDAEAGYTIDWKSGLRLGLEFNRASGDDSSSSTFTRYHQLFPTVHRWLGYMDLFGRQNIQSGVFHALLKMDKKWSASVDVHSFWRVESQDLIYSIVTETPYAGQAAVPATDNMHVGEELDLVLSYNPVQFVALQAMGGVFLPGEYFKTAVGNDVGYFSYVQTTFSF